MIKDLKSICYKKFFLWHNDFIFVDEEDICETGNIGFVQLKTNAIPPQYRG